MSTSMQHVKSLIELSTKNKALIVDNRRKIDERKKIVKTLTQKLEKQIEDEQTQIAEDELELDDLAVQIELLNAYFEPQMPPMKIDEPINESKSEEEYDCDDVDVVPSVKTLEDVLESVTVFKNDIKKSSPGRIITKNYKK